MPLVPWPAGAPAPPRPARSPSLLLAIGLQLQLVREPWRRWRRRGELAAAARGDGRPVLVLPGMGVGDLSTHPLRRFLRRQGFDARGWGLGRNRPDVPRTLERVLRRLEEVATSTGEPVSLVGWSLGGVLAREAARLRPDLVRRVVTLGVPVVGGLRATALSRLFWIQGWDLDDVERRFEQASRVPIRVPLTAIFSRRDGIVAWQAAIDDATPGAENLEATSAHWALGFDPEVLTTLADRLAR